MNYYVSHEYAVEVCKRLGIAVYENGVKYFARHNVAGIIGPFSDEFEAWEVAYNTWAA